MQKNEFIKKVRAAMGDGAISQTKTEEVIAATFEVISKAMEERDKVAIGGFGSFESKPSPARMGRNPQTKEPIPIPASYRVKFTASALLEQRVGG